MKSDVDEVFAQAPSPLSDESKATLLAALECPPDRADAVSRELDGVAIDYVRQRQQDDVGAGGAGVNKAVLMIERMATEIVAAGEIQEARRKLNDALAVLNAEAAWALLSAARRRRPGLDLMAGHDWRIYTVEDIAGAAADAQVRRDGRPTDPTLAVAIARLVTVFENATGRRATHTPNKGAEYLSGPQSEVGRFVTAFFAGVDPKLPRSRLSSTLAGLVKARNACAA